MSLRKRATPVDLVPELANRLHAHFGPSGWWPADSPFEVMIGAILVQNTAWANVETAIANLRDGGLLAPRSLAACRLDRLKRLVRPAGYFNQKADRVKRFARWMLDRYDGSVEDMRRVPAAEMRRELLAFNGIGPESADSILCYALGHPIFVADAYTRRIFARHGLTPPRAGYHDLQTYVTGAVADDLHLYKELHAHIVYTGKHYCARRTPDCAACPLDGWHRHDPSVPA